MSGLDFYIAMFSSRATTSEHPKITHGGASNTKGQTQLVSVLSEEAPV